MIAGINAIGTLIIAIAVALITYKQYWIQRQAHRLSLFDRRFELFKAQQKFLSAIIKNANIDTSLIPEYMDAMQKSRFLLDDEMYAYLEQIYKASVDLLTANNIIYDQTVSPEREKYIDIKYQKLPWLVNQLPVLVEKYRSFLVIRG